MKVPEGFFSYRGKKRKFRPTTGYSAGELVHTGVIAGGVYEVVQDNGHITYVREFSDSDRIIEMRTCILWPLDHEGNIEEYLSYELKKQIYENKKEELKKYMEVI